MAKTRLTVEIDEELAKAVRSTAAGSDQQDSEVIERALRSYFGLRNTMDRMRAKMGDELIEDEDEANAYAVALVKEVRAERAQRAEDR